MLKFSKIFKDIWKRISKGGSKKLIEKVAIIAIVGVICLIAGSVLFEDVVPKKQEPAAASDLETFKQSEEGQKQDLEKNLQSILSKIKGAGKVDVMITFYSSNESIPAVDKKTSENDTQERDKEGGTRSIKQSDEDNSIIYEENQGVKKPFIVKEILPEVKGVVIVSDGAGDAVIKSNLAKATEALLNVAISKIQVFERYQN